MSRTSGKVPGQVSERIDALRTSLEEALPAAGELGRGSVDYHALIATATRYLPDAVDAYMALPRSFANHHVAGGTTALELLCDQLDLLASTVSELVENLRRSNLDRLAANGRFLEEKFGRGGLDVPPSAGGS